MQYGDAGLKKVLNELVIAGSRTDTINGQVYTTTLDAALKKLIAQYSVKGEIKPVDEGIPFTWIFTGLVDYSSPIFDALGTIPGAFQGEISAGTGVGAGLTGTYAGVPITFEVVATGNVATIKIENGDISVGQQVKLEASVSVAQLVKVESGYEYYHINGSSKCTCVKSGGNILACPATTKTVKNTQLGNVSVGGELFLGIGGSAEAGVDFNKLNNGLKELLNALTDIDKLYMFLAE